MPACPITSDEVARLDGIVAAVASAQETTPGARYARARTSHPAEFLALGLTQADLADAATLGFSSPGIHEYAGPHGVGWEFVVRLARGNEVWQRTFHHGPETWRARDWAVVAGSLGGAPE